MKGEPITGSIKIGGKKERKATTFMIICKKCGEEIELKGRSLTFLMATCKCGYEEEINLMRD